MAQAAPRHFGVYPERLMAHDGATPTFPLGWQDLVLATTVGLGGHAERFVANVLAIAKQAPFTETSIAQISFLLRHPDGGDAALATAFALIRNIIIRELGLTPHPEQMAGAYHMLRGRLVEMETGEGKTLTAIFVAGVHALSGRNCHVITTNDYLAQRDADGTGPVYRALGLSVDCVRMDMSEPQRRAAWRASIVYVTPKQLMFDYLRDRIKLGAKSASPLRKELKVLAAEGESSFYLRGLDAAVIDEADSVLIDEAVVPLIISRQEKSEEQAKVASRAIGLAGALVQDEHFILAREGKDVRLTTMGCTELDQLGVLLGGVFASKLWREQYVQQALAAIHLFKRDQDYIVKDGVIEIVDINTGRTMADRSWERGLHQMIQAKEQVNVTAPNESIARISHQAFFRRYLHVSGMSGTLREVKAEVRKIYGLRVVRVPTHNKLLRKDHGLLVARDKSEKDGLVARKTARLVAMGRPVLIGTRTVLDSERLSERLEAAGIAHTVLNARQDSVEADIIAAAGAPAAVTVATNMAGRGTDIRISDEVRRAGGLHVILTDRQESRRIDRQLFGRTARQGDPGSFEEIVSLEDDISLRFGTVALRKVLELLPVARVKRYYFDRCQAKASSRGVKLRDDFARIEEMERKSLSFASATRS
jgi:preprotein translocase subunit SecA